MNNVVGSVIKYSLVAAVCFYAGSCHNSKKVEAQPFYTFKESGKWYLVTPIGEKPINDNCQVGTVHERMSALLEEKYSDLKGSLEKIVGKKK
jgi:hypothetical protein